jgi:nitroreductase
VPFWLTDAAMAAMLMLLVAIDEGLGAWFSGISYGERSVLHQFGVPAEFKPVGVVMLGYPAASDPLSTPSSAYSRPRRPVADLMHHDRW